MRSPRFCDIEIPETAAVASVPRKRAVPEPQPREVEAFTNGVYTLGESDHPTYSARKEIAK